MENRKKHKVVFIHPDLGIGGAERLVLDVAVALAEKGNEVSFVTNHFDKTHAFQELQDGQFHVRVVGDWIPRSVCGICQALCAYLRMIFLSLVYVLFFRKEDKPDVYFIDQIPMAIPFIKLTGGKVIYYCHHPDLLASPPGGRLKRFYRMPIDWLESKGTAIADVILVNSEYTASVFCKTFPQIEKDIHIVYPTISASYQSSIENYKNVKSINELVPEIKATEDQVIFLSINRYHPAKKLELALSGLEALKSKVSPDDWQRVHLVVAGGFDPQSTINATYFTNLINTTQEKNLVTKVTFLKSLSDDLKVDLLLACDCLIYTPINEHFGIVPLEAMIAGKPVIACNSGGPRETVQNEVSGLLCEPNGDSLATAMSKILDRNNAYRMGQEGKKRLQKYFSHAVFVSSINDVVGSIVCDQRVEKPNASPIKQETNTVEEGDEELRPSKELSPEKEISKSDEQGSGDSDLQNKDEGNDSFTKSEEQNNENITDKGSPPKAQTPTEFKNLNVSDDFQYETPQGGHESEESEEQSPTSVEETQNEENVKSPAKEISAEGADTPDLEFNQSKTEDELLLQGTKIRTSPKKLQNKSATTDFLQNETDSNKDMLPNENEEISGNARAHYE